MEDKYLCNGLNCSVYVFGVSTQGVCPECGDTGTRISGEPVAVFLEWYENARARPVIL